MGGREVSGHIVSDIEKKTIIIEECVQWNVDLNLSQIGRDRGQELLKTGSIFAEAT